MTCPYCRKEIAADTKVCWNCKAAIEPPKVETAEPKNTKKEK